MFPFSTPSKHVCTWKPGPIFYVIDLARELFSAFLISLAHPMKRVIKNGAPGSRQAYMNKSKYNPNRYKQEKNRVSRQTEFAMTSLCCRRCCEIIQWKVDYGKYTSQEQRRCCNLCRENKVIYAYHRICQQCAEREAVCAKCQKHSAASVPITEGDVPATDSDQESTEGTVEDVQKPRESSKYAFVDVAPDEEELQRLTGLNTRVLQKKMRKQWEAENRESLGSLRERERRTVLRKKCIHTDTSDSDENL
ncbi:hypothetical protein, conserved [Leishmania tarentolae]|uniref:Uncharacterized protein n=1 Tax=Leishmania tarentolae TaxID=5689 RepID=A0A640KXC2_LEITA|nr:hypothetical protein, conserved [Leishmania tarentolae]